MSEASLTDIIQETLVENPVADNLEIDVDLEDDDLESSEAAVDELINGIPEDDEDDESDEDGSEESELDDEGLEKLQVKVDGEVLDVTLKELKAGYQRQADYTRKAQALAAEKESFEQAVTEFSDTLGTLQQLDTAWDDNPVKVLAHFTANTSNPTHSVALLIKELAAAGMLDSEFMEVFGITSDVRETWGRDSEVENLRQRAASTEKNAAQRLEQVEYERQVQAAIAEYDRQIDEILEAEGVDLTVSQRNAFRTRLATYAHDNELTNLKAAHKALKYEESQRKKVQAKKSVERAKQKKATSVVGRSSSGANGSTPIEDNSDLNAVIRAAMRDVSPS
jgi:hypothetical protein